MREQGEAWVSTFMRSVPLRRLLLAGLMAATATVAAQTATAHAATAPASTAAKITGCGPTYTSYSASATAPWGGSSVPWRSVGTGWLLATVSAKESGTGPQTLYLVSPGGTRYQLGQAPAGATLEDWSGASMDALFLDQPESGTKAAVSVLNLKTGQAGGFTLYSPLTDTEISFTHPSAQGILVLASHDSSGGYLPVQRYSLSGARQICYPNSFRGAGSGAFEYRESPAGPDLVLQTQNGLEVMSNAGHPVRFLPEPHGYSFCSPLNWWTSQTILASCSNNNTTLVFAFPLSGAKPTAVTTVRQSATFLGIWRLPSGTYAQAAACGSSWLERLNANGTATTLTIPGAANAGNVAPLGTHGSQLALWVAGGCDGHTPYSKVDWYNPETNVATTVLGASAGGGFVSEAMLFPSS
jgi:hypothetical protein